MQSALAVFTAEPKLSVMISANARQRVLQLRLREIVLLVNNVGAFSAFSPGSILSITMLAATNIPTDPDDTPTASSRWRKQATLAAICLGFGVLILPALIYVVGAKILGAYGGGPGISSFYGDFFRNLISGGLRTWFIVLGPYLLLAVLRLIFWPRRNKLPVNQAGPIDAIAQPTATRERREPFVAP